MNVPLDRMLTFIPRRLVHNGRKTKLITSHLGSAVPTPLPESSPPRPISSLAVKGCVGAAWPEEGSPSPVPWVPHFVILCTDERCPHPTEAAVESLSASREIDTLLGDEFGSLAFQSSFFFFFPFLFGLQSHTPLLLSNSSAHPKPPPVLLLGLSSSGVPVPSRLPPVPVSSSPEDGVW